MKMKWFSTADVCVAHLDVEGGRSPPSRFFLLVRGLLFHCGCFRDWWRGFHGNMWCHSSTASPHTHSLATPTSSRQLHPPAPTIRALHTSAARLFFGLTCKTFQQSLHSPPTADPVFTTSFLLPGSPAPEDGFFSSNVLERTRHWLGAYGLKTVQLCWAITTSALYIPGCTIKTNTLCSLIPWTAF